jgi:hypothetical protein
MHVVMAKWSMALTVFVHGSCAGTLSNLLFLCTVFNTSYHLAIDQCDCKDYVGKVCPVMNLVAESLKDSCGGHLPGPGARCDILMQRSR